MTTFRPSDEIAILATVDPEASSVSACWTSDWADFEYFESMMAIGLLGVAGAGATINFKLLQATSAAGSQSKDITSAAIVETDTASNDKQFIINCHSSDLDIANGFRYVAMKYTNGTVASDLAAVLLGVKAKHGPASGHDLSTVAQIITP